MSPLSATDYLKTNELLQSNMDQIGVAITQKTLLTQWFKCPLKHVSPCHCSFKQSLLLYIFSCLCNWLLKSEKLNTLLGIVPSLDQIDLSLDWV